MKILANRKSLLRRIARLKLPARMLFTILVISLICGLFLLAKELRLIYQKTGNFLENENLKQSKQNEIAFEKIPLTAHPNKNVRIWQSTKNVRSIAHFQNSVFAATDGGLLRLSETGKILRHLTVLDGLPESDLLALAVFQSKLYIGTRSRGLLSFDGENFESFQTKNHETKSINTLSADEKTLLIGTLAGGLLAFDGKNLREIKAPEIRLNHLTFLKNENSHLFIGTFDNGLWIRQNQIWKQLTTADGLLSNRVVGVEIIGDKIFVGTDLGLSVGALGEIFTDQQKLFSQNVILPTLSSLMLADERLFLTKDNGEILSTEHKFFDSSKLIKHRFYRPENLQNAKLFKDGREIWLLSNQGVWQNNLENDLSLTKFAEIPPANDLEDNSISALAIDQEQRIWIGTFRRGVDIFSPNGNKIRHLETETIREINHFLPDPEKSTMIISTSGGLEIIDQKLESETKTENIPGRSVFQTSAVKTPSNQIFTAATAKGLFYKTDGETKIFSSINDLPGNSAYTTLFARNSLFVGTLGGLAEIQNGKVVRVYKTSNSRLKNNWITALCAIDERIFIGTYGGGVYELLPANEIRSLTGEIGKIFVNPNAVFADQQRLYVGTLEGVWTLDLISQKWSQIIDILPAETVLAIAGNNENILIGTTHGISVINRKFWINN